MSDDKPVSDDTDDGPTDGFVNGNVAKWEYFSVLTASEANGVLDPEQVESGSVEGTNTWSTCGYFTKKPELELDDGTNLDLRPVESEFIITYDDATNQQLLDTTGHNPDSDTSSQSFDVTLGAGVGPLSAGTTLFSADLDTTVDLINNSYTDTTWKIQYGSLDFDSSIPTEPGDCSGVRWDFRGHDYNGFMGVNVENNFTFEAAQTFTRVLTVVTDTAETNHSATVELVDPNAPFVSNNDSRAKDIDADGTYEDVNGDGRISITDLFDLAFDVYGTPLEDEYDNPDDPINFDVNQDGKIDLDDVFDLFDELADSQSDYSNASASVSNSTVTSSSGSNDVQLIFDVAGLNLTPGSTGDAGVIVKGADNGVPAMNIMVEVEDKSVLEIVDASLTNVQDGPSPQIKNNGEYVPLKMATGDDETGDVQVATISVKKKTSESSSLNIKYRAVSDNSGDEYSVSGTESINIITV